jgi:hypothetical protein
MLAIVRARLSIAGELLGFLWRARLWWMIPIVVVLLMASVLLILAQSSAIAPFIYAVF